MDAVFGHKVTLSRKAGLSFFFVSQWRTSRRNLELVLAYFHAKIENLDF